jgi:RNA polymerase-binding transcription factor DksA/uncharacterized protein (DUF302 family)
MGTNDDVAASGADRRVSVYYIVSTAKPVDAAARSLETAARKHEFGVLHVIDLKDALTKKGYPLEAQCKIFEICNPREATRVLQRDLRLNMALPCRISVFEDNGITKIGAILPGELLRALSHDEDLAGIAEAVEASIKLIIDEAAAAPDARSALLQRRAALLGEIEAGKAKRGQGRDGNVPDSGELAADDIARDVGIAEVERDMGELAAIDAALDRLELGTYGRCRDCDVDIEPARLERNPEVGRCASCQTQAESSIGIRIARL